METTFRLGSYELQIVAAQDQIARPSKRFVAEDIILRGSGGDAGNGGSSSCAR